MPTPTDKSLQAAAQTVAADAIKTLVGLGKVELTDAALKLQQFVPAAARWEAERQQARAANDTAKLDTIDRNFDMLAADGIAVLVEAGVLGQAEAEKFVGGLLTMLGKFALAAIVAI